MTRIAIVTEGDSEVASLPLLREQLEHRTHNQIVGHFKVAVPPDAAVAVVGRACAKLIRVAEAKRPDRVVFVLDRETQQECPGGIAASITAEIRRHCAFDDIRVVLKNQVYENWLLADLEALRAQPARFVVSHTLVGAVEPNRADSAQALRLIKSAVVSGHYDKVADSKRIMSRADVTRALLHSRSFRHFLHALGDPTLELDCRTARGN